MNNRYAKLKILCIVAAGLAAIVLASLQPGDQGPYTNPASGIRPAGGTARETARRQAPAAGEQAGSKAVQDASAKAAGDVDKWNHSVKSLLQAEGFTIRNLELLKDGTYPILYVTLPFKLDTENEGRMTGIIEKIAGANSWRDFEMVDSAADARITVACDRQFDMIDEVIINGDRNYFVRLSQKKAVENYSYIEPLNFKSGGKLLKLLSETGWLRKGLESELGDSDSYFDGYLTYFDEGISVKYSRDRVYNIVLHSGYRETVLNKIGLGGDRRKVVEMLGTPQFEAPDRELYGYKSQDYYIFFTGEDRLKEISIYYRNTAYGRDTLPKLLDRYDTDPDRFDLYSFIGALKTQWPDYDLYYSERGGLGISYDSIGVSADNSYEDRGGPYITVYGNYEGAVAPALELPGKIEGLGDYSNDLLLLKLDTDSIFASEERRLEREGQLDQLRRGEGTVSPDGTMKVVDNDGGTYEHAGLYIFSADGGRPDAELRTGHFTGRVIWMDNRYFIYDVSMTGVFIYDTIGKKVMDVLRSDLGKHGDYELESYKEGIITIKNLIDDSTLTKKCSVSPGGAVSIE